MKSSSRRGLIGGLLAGFFLGGVGGRIAIGDQNLSLEEMADLYLEQSGFWHSLRHAVNRESSALSSETNPQAFQQLAWQKLKQKYISHFTSSMSRNDFARLLEMNEDQASLRFNQACLQMNAEAKNLIAGVFAEVRLSAHDQNKV